MGIPWHKAHKCRKPDSEITCLNFSVLLFMDDTGSEFLRRGPGQNNNALRARQRSEFSVSYSEVARTRLDFGERALDVVAMGHAWPRSPRIWPTRAKILSKPAQLRSTPPQTMILRGLAKDRQPQHLEAEDRQQNFVAHCGVVLGVCHKDRTDEEGGAE